MAQRIIYLILLVGAALFGAGVVLFFLQNPLYAQTSYYGPTSPHPNLIKVDIQAYDDPNLGGVKIEDVSFNGQSIGIKPSGIHGMRGGGSFQVSPGTYKLIWHVSRSTKDWPRTIAHQQKIQVTPNDDWIQITIQGEKVEIL